MVKDGLLWVEGEDALRVEVEEAGDAVGDCGAEVAADGLGLLVAGRMRSSMLATRSAHEV